MVPIAIVYRNLASLHGAGIPWPEAVDSAASGDARFAQARAMLAQGTAVSTAFEAAGIAEPLDVAALRAGETSGRMEAALTALAVRHETEDRVRRERRASIAYPIFLLHAAALLMPVPDLIAGRVGAALSWAAIALVPLYGVFLLVALARRAAKRDPSLARAGWARPFLGRAWIDEADARALSALGWLYEAGVPLDAAIPLARRAGDGGRVAADLADAGRSVAARRPMSEGGWRSVPESIRSRLINAETTGTLGKACAEGAAWLESSAAARRKRFAAVLPPVVMLLVGGIIAWRVISFYASYFSRVSKM
jgi:type II secretory pathway component PulF